MECLAIGDLDDAESHPPVDAILNLSRFDYPTRRIYRQIYFPDFEFMQNVSLIGQCTEYIHEQIAQRHRVLVHCFAGISRSSTICIAYLHECGMSFGEALDFLKQRHPIAQPHVEMLRSLHEWYQPSREQGVLL